MIMVCKLNKATKFIMVYDHKNKKCTVYELVEKTRRSVGVRLDKSTYYDAVYRVLCIVNQTEYTVDALSIAEATGDYQQMEGVTISSIKPISAYRLHLMSILGTSCENNMINDCVMSLSKKDLKRFLRLHRRYQDDRATTVFAMIARGY